MRKRFWTTRKNKYKIKTRKHKKTHHKKTKRIKMKGGTLSSIIGTLTTPFDTHITAAGNVISTPYVWRQHSQVPGSYGI